jgi:hypothetical protein
MHSELYCSRGIWKILQKGRGCEQRNADSLERRPEEQTVACGAARFTSGNTNGCYLKWFFFALDSRECQEFSVTPHSSICNLQHIA